MTKEDPTTIPNPRPLLTAIWLEIWSDRNCVKKSTLMQGTYEKYLDTGNIGEVEAQDEVLKAGRGHETQVEDHVS